MRIYSIFLGNPNIGLYLLFVLKFLSFVIESVICRGICIGLVWVGMMRGGGEAAGGHRPTVVQGQLWVHEH